MPVQFNKEDGQFHAIMAGGQDLGVVNRDVLAAINAHREAAARLITTLQSVDIVGYDATPEEDRLTDERHEAEEDAALACVYLAQTSADNTAVNEYASHQKGTDTIGQLQAIPTRFIEALGRATLPDASQSQTVRSLITAHIEANATKGAVASDDDGSDAWAEKYNEAMKAEQRAAIALCARMKDGDITPDDDRDFASYAAVYGQDDGNKTSLHWALQLPADVLFTLRQHYRPQPSQTPQRPLTWEEASAAIIDAHRKAKARCEAAGEAMEAETEKDDHSALWAELIAAENAEAGARAALWVAVHVEAEARDTPRPVSDYSMESAQPNPFGSLPNIAAEIIARELAPDLLELAKAVA